MFRTPKRPFLPTILRTCLLIRLSSAFGCIASIGRDFLTPNVKLGPIHRCDQGAMLLDMISKRETTQRSESRRCCVSVDDDELVVGPKPAPDVSYVVSEFLRIPCPLFPREPLFRASFRQKRSTHRPQLQAIFLLQSIPPFAMMMALFPPLFLSRFLRTRILRFLFSLCTRFLRTPPFSWDENCSNEFL